MGKVFNAMLKKRMESDQSFSTRGQLEKVDMDFTLSSFINRRRSQRRIHPRAETDWPITIIKNDSPLHGRVRNISQGGALFYVQEEITVGEKVLIAIEVQEFSDVITAEAEVVRSYSVISGIDSSTYGIGIKYITISKESIRFFSANLTNAWEEKKHSHIKYWNFNFFTKNILLIISIFFIAFFYIKMENIEKIYSERIKYLESIVISSKNSINDFDKKINDYLSNYDGLMLEREKTITPYLLYNYHFASNLFSKNQYINNVISEKFLNEDIFISQNKNKAASDKQFNIDIGRLKIENYKEAKNRK